MPTVRFPTSTPCLLPPHFTFSAACIQSWDMVSPDFPAFISQLTLTPLPGVVGRGWLPEVGLPLVGPGICSSELSPVSVLQMGQQGNRGLGHSAAARLPLGSVSTSPLWGHRLPYAASGLQNVTALASRHLRAWRLPGTRGPSPLPALPFPLEFTDRDWMEPAGYEPGGASLGSGVPEMSAHFWAGSLAQEVTYMCVCDVSLGVHPGSWT